MKKKLAVIAIMLVFVVSLCACTQEVFDAVMGLIMEAMGYGKQPLEIQCVDTEATIQSFESNGLYIEEISVENYTQGDLENMGIEGIEIPVSMQVAYPDVSLDDQIDIELLMEIEAAAILEYESEEQAKEAETAILNLIQEITSEQVVEMLGDESYVDLIEALMFLRDYINVQAVGNTVTIYTTPAADLFVEGSR